MSEPPPPEPPRPPLFLRARAELLALRFVLKAGTWGAPQPHELTWAPPIALPALPVREGVTLCAPWVEVYERELEAALRASGRELLPMPTAELHPNASPDLLQLMRDGWRHDAHRANLPGRPDPWEELVALRLLGVAMNRLLPEHVELAEVSLLEARSEPRPGRPEGCICDFASTGHHRFSCLRQGQVVLPVEGSPESGFRVRR